MKLPDLAIVVTGETVDFRETWYWENYAYSSVEIKTPLSGDGLIEGALTTMCANCERWIFLWTATHILLVCLGSQQ